ncbi:MAG: hypothetical protein PHG18_01910 [Bacilli bacterium]|nr:hypothetical protein [Bacilli bacterium]
MLEILKEMQKQGVFKIISSDIDLDNLIENAETYNDIKTSSSNIRDYIKELDEMLTHNCDIVIGKVMSDFYDKFNYELFDMYLANKNVRTNINEKDTSYGNAGNISIGLNSKDVKFTLEERKLMKLVNHYYITQRSNEFFEDKILYIPINQLKLMFSDGINHKVVKDIIVETCNRLNNKKIYWDFSKTTYSKTKKLKDKKLDKCNGDKLLDIVIVYQPWGNDENNTIKGILCRVNNFLRLRYTLKQIEPKYLSSFLQENYLEFIISDKLFYHMRLKKNNKNRLFQKTIYDLAKEIYDYKNNIQLSTNFLSLMKNDKHKPREQVKLLKAIIKVAYYFMKNEYIDYRFSLVVNDICVNLIGYSGKVRKVEDVYNEITKIISGSQGKKQVNEICMICNELSKIKKIELSTFYTNLHKYKFIRKERIEEYYQLIYDERKENINIEMLKNILINDIETIKRNVLLVIEKGQISLKVEFK